MTLQSGTLSHMAELLRNGNVSVCVCAHRSAPERMHACTFAQACPASAVGIRVRGRTLRGSSHEVIAATVAASAVFAAPCDIRSHCRWQSALPFFCLGGGHSGRRLASALPLSRGAYLLASPSAGAGRLPFLRQRRHMHAAPCMSLTWCPGHSSPIAASGTYFVIASGFGFPLFLAAAPPSRYPPGVSWGATPLWRRPRSATMIIAAQFRPIVSRVPCALDVCAATPAAGGVAWCREGLLDVLGDFSPT